MIIPIPKKGEMTLCKNYRGITLLKPTYKVLTVILRNRLTQHTETINQFGHRKYKSTINAICIMKQITEESVQHGVNMLVLFNDFKQTFDMINRKSIINDLKKWKQQRKL